MAKQTPNQETPKCPITRAEFHKHALPIAVRIGEPGEIKIAQPKDFQSSSFGWYCGEKVVLMINGKPVKVQVGINLTIVGSKDVPLE